MTVTFTVNFSLPALLLWLSGFTNSSENGLAYPRCKAEPEHMELIKKGCDRGHQALAFSIDQHTQCTC